MFAATPQDSALVASPAIANIPAYIASRRAGIPPIPKSPAIKFARGEDEDEDEGDVRFVEDRCPRAENAFNEAKGYLPRRVSGIAKRRLDYGEAPVPGQAAPQRLAKNPMSCIANPTM